MDGVDRKILKEINKVSSKYFTSPVKVNEVLKLDPTEFGNRLMQLKKSGYVELIINDYPSSLTLPNAISEVHITDLGRETLKDKK